VRKLVIAIVSFVSLPALGGEIRGRLTLEQKPAAGVTVSAAPYETGRETALREAKGEAAPAPIAQTVTGSDGSYVLALPQDAARPLQIRAEGGGAVAVELGGPYDGAESDDLGETALARAARLSGRVLDGAGAGIAGAEVTLLASGTFLNIGDSLTRLPRTAITGADGSFRFEDAASDQSSNAIVVRKPGFAPVRLANQRAGAVGKPIVLAPGRELAGTVRLPDKKTPVKGALVRFEGSASSRWIAAGDDGKFVVKDLPAGSGTLTVDAGDAGWKSVANLKAGAQAAPLNVVLEPVAVLEGRAVDAKTGRAVPRAKLVLRGGSGAMARTGPDGKYRLKPLAPGRYELAADDPRYVAFRRDTELHPSETKRLDVVLVPGASMSGRVVDEDGRPVAGARGFVTRGSENPLMSLRRQFGNRGKAAFTTAADGTFRASRLTPGENQRIETLHRDYVRATLGGLSLEGGATRSGVNLVMRKGATLAGLVRDANGAPLPGAEVAVRGSGNVTMRRGGAMMMTRPVVGPGSERLKTGADGRFEVKGLATGEYGLVVTKPGYASERIDPITVTEAPLQPVEVTLQGGSAISGVVKRRTGEPVENAVVMLAPRRGPGTNMEAPRPTGPDGAFVIEGLKSGQSYDLMLMSESGTPVEKNGIVAPADGVEFTVVGTGSIAGLVVDAASGRPITDYEVSYEPAQERGGGAIRMVMRMAGQGRGTTTPVHAEDGVFQLDQVPAGSFEVKASARGYQGGHVSATVQEGEVTKGVEIKLQRGGSLHVHVADARSGRAVPEASVEHSSSAGRNPFPMQMMLGGGGADSNVTNADGDVDIDGLSPGSYRITVQHPDYAQATETVEVKETGGSVQVRLGNGGTLGGAVLSETRQPAAGVEVSLAPAGSAGFRGFTDGSATVTDSSGRFRFDRLGAGRYTVNAALRGKNSTPVESVLQENETKEDLLLTISAGATLHGTVVNAPDTATVNVQVTGPEDYSASTRVSGDGRFELTGLPTGAVTVRAFAGDFMGSTRSVVKQVTVPQDGALVEVELAFEPGFTVAGSVNRGGRGVPDVTVFAMQQGLGRLSTSRTDSSGAYKLEGLERGTYEINVERKRETVKVDGDRNLDFDLPTARVSGVVVESGSRQPLVDASVSVSSDTPGLFGGGQNTTDSNGRFVFDDLEPKSYTISVRKPGFQLEKKTVSAGDPGPDVTVELVRGEGLSVQVRDGLYNVPLRGLMARVEDATGASLFGSAVGLDDQGRGEIPSLKPGSYRLYAQSSGYAPVELSVSVPSPTVPITLTPGGTVEIHAGSETLASGSAKLQMLSANGRPYRFSAFGPGAELTMATPVRRLENIAPGSYSLVGLGGVAKSFQVAEGRLVIVELP